MKFVKTLIAVLGVLCLAFAGAAFGAPVAHSDVLGMGGFGMVGMLVNKENVTNLFISLKTTFNNAFAAAPTVWEKIAMKVPSTTGQNIYAWLSKFPKMQKWVGEKDIKALEAFKYTVVNDDFEATVEVDRNDIDDDNLGIYAPQAQMAGESAKQLPDEIVIDLVNKAFTTQCFDGQYFFDPNHKVGDVNVSNKGTKQLNASSSAAADASFGVGRLAMRKFKDNEGRPLNITPNILLVGPALETTALKLRNNEFLAVNDSNPYRGTFEVVVDARITSDTAWYLLDTTKAVKPFIYQERKAPVFVSQTDMSSDDVFSRKKYKFGAEARAAGGYGFWQLAYGSDGTVA
jgi:phage major head subunit gpT-like protein